MPWQVAKLGVKARSLWFSRVDGHRGSLAFRAVTGARVARASLAAIRVSADTGRGGEVLACSWTLWDGGACAVVITGKRGKEGWLGTVRH